jgi:hypothetical protein
MIATYGQHKDKTGSTTIATTKQLEEHPAEPEAKIMRVHSSDLKEATMEEETTPTILATSIQ